MPALMRDFRREPEIERRPVLGEVLPWREALLIGPRRLAGEETAFLRPALLAARQLGIRRRLLFVGHGPKCLIRGDASPIHAWCRAWSSRSAARRRSCPRDN